MRNIEKILAKVEYKKKLNSARTTEISTEYELITAEEHLKEIKNKVSLNSSIKFSGKLLYLLSFMGLIASTALSLAGGLPYYSGLSQYAFIIAIVFVQLIIFKVSTLESIIKTKFNNHYFTFKLLQYGLLTVSIYYNYDFFAKHSVGFKPITLMLCILLDVATIKIISLAWDSNRLNYSEIETVETVGLIKAVMFNKIFEYKLRALKQYKVNVDRLRDEIGTVKEKEEVKQNPNYTVAEDKELEQSFKPVEAQTEQNFKHELEQRDKALTLNEVQRDKEGTKKNGSKVLTLKPKTVDNTDGDKVLTLLKDRYKDGDKVNVGEIKEALNLSQKQWVKVKDQIKELETVKTNTFYRGTKGQRIEVQK